MKLSKYNFLSKHEGATLFFNACTCALAIVDENFLRVLDDINSGTYDESKYDPKLIDDMKTSGCIIDDDVDELSRLEFYRNIAKYDTTRLGLTIAPTLDCNFRCKYCFERHPKGVMSEEVQSALLKFVENRLHSVRNFSVTWYGGEPLLTKNIIYKLSENFLELCRQKNVEYNAFIITNASLMDDADIEHFKRCKINGAQITIDGPKDVHDKRRRNIDGASTFDHLIDRVNVLLNNDFDVIVRINIDKENIDRVDELLDTLKERLDRYQNVKIDFGQVSTFTDICRSIESDCYNNAQYADMMIPLYSKVEARGFTVNKMFVYPSTRANYCCVDYVNSFVVDNHGQLFRCWNHVGNTKKSCGNIADFDQAPLRDNYLSWIEWNPLRHEKCRECKYLPLCMGGCSDARRNSEDGQPVCGTVKYNLDKVLKYYYEQLKGGEAI